MRTRFDDGYEIDTDRARLDLGAIHAFLVQSYWSPGIARARVALAIEHSLCFGVYAPDGAQIGFARVVTDFARFGYLADVYVLEAHRGRGLGERLVRTVLDHPDLRELGRFLLATSDAHGLYAAHGFTPLAAPERMMEIVRVPPTDSSPP